MKKATFFVTLIMLLLLAGCGKKDSSANEEVELLRQEVAELKASMETLNAEPTATIVQEEPTVVEEEPEAVEESEEPKVHRTLSSQTSSSSFSSNTTLSCGYAASFFSLTDELKDINTRESAKENPYVLPYPGKGAYRDIWFYLTGETVKAVYNVNEDWERVEELSFEEANGATGFFYNMKYGAGDYFFEIVTSQNSYFIGVRY